MWACFIICLNQILVSPNVSLSKRFCGFPGQRWPIAPRGAIQLVSSISLQIHILLCVDWCVVVFLQRCCNKLLLRTPIPFFSRKWWNGSARCCVQRLRRSWPTFASCSAQSTCAVWLVQNQCHCRNVPKLIPKLFHQSFQSQESLWRAPKNNFTRLHTEVGLRHVRCLGVQFIERFNVFVTF